MMKFERKASVDPNSVADRLLSYLHRQKAIPAKVPTGETELKEVPSKMRRIHYVLYTCGSELIKEMPTCGITTEIFSL